MKVSKKLIIIIATILVLLIGGGVTFAMNSPTARVERQLNLGNKYLQEGKYQEAILAFRKVIEIEPKNIPARLGLGKAYVATNEYEEAEAVLKEVIDIDPNNIPAREELFKVYVKEGNLEAANGVLKEIAALDPQKDMEQYNTDLNLAKDISTSKACYDLGIKQMNDKQYLEAIDSFQKVIKEDSKRYDDAQAKISECKKAFIDETLQKAKDTAANNDYQKALNLLEQVLKVDPNNQEALQLKSDYIDRKSSQKSVANNTSILYENKTYGFALNIPKSWEGKYHIEERDASNILSGSNYLHSINFLYKSSTGDFPLVGIGIFTGKKEDLYKDPAITILGSKGDKIYYVWYALNCPEGNEGIEFSRMGREFDISTFRII